MSMMNSPISSTDKQQETIPRTLPAVASPRPDSAPPEESTSSSALRPRTQANGAHSGQNVMPTMPSMSAAIAPSARGELAPGGGAAKGSLAGGGARQASGDAPAGGGG